MIYATMNIYQDIMRELLPTPAKSHYIFNLRDVSKVFQGVLLSKPMYINSSASIIKLWAHEVMRVFHDRLINKEDKDWFIDNLIS